MRCRTNSSPLKLRGARGVTSLGVSEVTKRRSFGTSERRREARSEANLCCLHNPLSFTPPPYPKGENVCPLLS